MGQWVCLWAKCGVSVWIEWSGWYPAEYYVYNRAPAVLKKETPWLGSFNKETCRIRSALLIVPNHIPADPFFLLPRQWGDLGPLTMTWYRVSKNWVLTNWAFGDPAVSWEKILMIFVANLQMLNWVKLSFLRHPVGKFIKTEPGHMRPLTNCSYS